MTSSDYYAFRTQIRNTNSPYGLHWDQRYRFNGKEISHFTNDQTNYDYGFRIYNAGIGRFLSVDPLTKSYPELTPYQFASNTPIWAIDLDGLEAKISTVKNTFFIELKNVEFSFIIRKSNQFFTQASGNNSNYEDFSVNTQMFDRKSSLSTYYFASSPQPTKDYIPQGFNVNEGKIINGRSSPNTFYFSQNQNCIWSCGKGDVPMSSKFGFGGGIPLIVNGLKYGDGNLYVDGAPSGLQKFGPPGTENEKYLKQRNNDGYASQNKKNVNTGKTIIGFNSTANIWMIISQQDGMPGMTFDEIRDKLFNLGYDNVLGFDGSSSSTLNQDGKKIVSPEKYKDSTIPSGVNISVPKK